MTDRSHHAWAVLWRSKNALDGETTRILGYAGTVAKESAGFPFLLFDSRAAAQAYIRRLAR